jgi:glycosyltransferase involved in cell wall biosynthesis
MRVTHIITRLIVGGAQQNTIATVQGLHRQAGVEVHLLAGPTRGPEGSLESEVASIPGRFALIPELVRPLHPWHDARALHRLIQFLRQRRPDIVHTHSGKAGFLGRIAAYRAGVPVIIHTIHGPSFGPFQGVLSNGLYRSAERFAARVTTRFVVVADAMTRQYLAAGVGRPEQYVRVFSGFALDPFLTARRDPAEQARWGIRPDELVVGTIARLFKLKGHDDLIDVAPALVAQVPRIKFLLVGDGAWRGRLEARVRRLGLSRHFVFAGLVPPADIPRMIGLMDILVHLSRREGLARALPQALAAGRPVVAYDCDGAREVCRDNETGFCVPPGDRQRLVERLLLLARDPTLRERLGGQGQAWVRQEFAESAMVEKLLALYRQLLPNTP